MTSDDIIKQLIQNGADKLHILSDFDRTLTNPVVNGQEIPSLISVLRDHGYLTPEYAKKAHALFDQYHSIEIDPTINRQKKKSAMREWWTRHFALLIASGLTQKDIRDAMIARHAQLRDGAHEFFSFLKTHNIPIVIMSSSGLGISSIQLFLEAENEMHENVFIVSNQYEWDKNGKAVAVKEPIIHGMNKDETLLSNFPEIYARIKNRANVVLLGDNESDLGMIAGFPYRQLLTIGFLDTPSKTAPTFDMMLDPSSSLEPVTALLKKIHAT